MSPKKPLRLVGYARVSATKGRSGESFISTEQQRETILNFARSRGHEVVSWAEDIDVSGGKMDRPGLEEAFRLIESGDADGIAVAKLDRFARSIAGAYEAVTRLEEAGGVLLSADLDMDTSTSGGKLMRNVLLALAEFELDRIRDGWKYARSRAILERGTHVTNATPPGYLRTVVETRRDGSKVYGPLEVDPVAGPVIQEVFRRRAKGASYGSLCNYLDEALPRDGGRRWAVRTISDLLTREVYLGVAHWGDVRKKTHEPLVDKETFDTVQRLRRPRENGTPEEPRRGSSSTLAGLVRCAECRHSMVRSGDGHGHYVYRCRGRHADRICDAPAIIGGKKLEKIVRGEIRERMEAWGRDAIEGDLGKQYEAARRAVEEAEEELTAWTGSGLLSKIGEDAFLQGFRQREEAVAAARAELDATPAPEERIEVETSEIEDDRVLRAVARHWIDVVRVAKGRPPAVEVVWR